MSMQFVTLASGSAGNSAYVGHSNKGILIDLGLGPKKLQQRLQDAGLSLDMVQAVLLTHTHTDHWHDRSLALLLERKIPFFCHSLHHLSLQNSENFVRLLQAQLVHSFRIDQNLSLANLFDCQPFLVPHDSGVTCGFRLTERRPGSKNTTMVYASDLGSWDRQIVKAFANADLIAVEFNHDVELQKSSPRAQFTINRNLGKAGHLSNEQAAELVGAILQESQPHRLQHVVQLHLSRDCNRPELADQTLRRKLKNQPTKPQIHQAKQHEVGPLLKFTPLNNGKSTKRSQVFATVSQYEQLFLPGWEDC